MRGLYHYQQAEKLLAKALDFDTVTMLEVRQLHLDAAMIHALLSQAAPTAAIAGIHGRILDAWENLTEDEQGAQARDVPRAEPLLRCDADGGDDGRIRCVLAAGHDGPHDDGQDIRPVPPPTGDCPEPGCVLRDGHAPDPHFGYDSSRWPTLPEMTA